MSVTPGELLFLLACTAVGTALGALRAAWLLHRDDRQTELAAVYALPVRQETS